jgi:hypothetical protein
MNKGDNRQSWYRFFGEIAGIAAAFWHLESICARQRCMIVRAHRNFASVPSTAAVGAVILVVTAAAQSGIGPLTDDFWLLGDFTRNVPCNGDGSDPIELKVRISTDQIDSKAGACKIRDAMSDGKRVNMRVECQLPTGPIIGNITFTQKTSGAVDFIEGNGNYATTLYRCPK